MIREDWKYTNPDKIAGLNLPPASATIRLPSLPAGSTQHALTAEDFFSGDHPALAPAQNSNCMALRIDGILETPLQLSTLAQANSAGFAQIKLTLAKGSQLTLQENVSGEENSFLGLSLLIEIEDGASLTHTRFQNADSAHSQLSRTQIVMGANATYRQLALSTGAALWRHEVDVRLNGQNTTCQIDAINLLRATQHGDTTTRIRHLAPQCASRQRVRTVLAEAASGAFQGLIHVAPHAQKTDGQQSSRALLLSDNATMNSKPELEIFADDVKCGHGSTMGAIDPLALFYLRARGIPETEARWLLIESFVAELLDEAPEFTRTEARLWLERLT